MSSEGHQSDKLDQLEQGLSQSEKELEAGLAIGPFRQHRDFINALNGPERGAAYEVIAKELRSVWVSLPEAADVLRATAWFEDFLSHNELGLALDVICDVLLQPDVQVDGRLFSRVERLHMMMGIADERLALLKRQVR